MWRRRHLGKKYANPFRSRPKKLSRSFFIIPLVIFICFILYSTLFSNFWNIQRIELNGNFPIAAAEAKATVEKFLNEGWFLKPRHFFLLDARKLARSFEENYPIDKAEVQKKFKTRAVYASVVGRQFAGYWISRGIGFIIDKNGQVIGLAPETNPGDNTLRIYDLDSGLPNVNEQVIEKEAMDFIAQFYKADASHRYKVKYWAATKTSSQLVLSVEEKYQIYFDYKQNIEDQLKALDKVINYVIKPEDRGRIEYIDLRFSERIYYKLR
jgi:cell division septal protein FtsQ